MLRRLLVLAGVFAATYIVASATGYSLAVAILASVVVGILWIVRHDVRRDRWPSETPRSHDAVYAAAAFAAFHAPGQAGADCSSGFDSFGGCGDAGGVGG
jgi:hypothetical protein